jgi:hypothetical protein
MEKMTRSLGNPTNLFNQIFAFCEEDKIRTSERFNNFGQQLGPCMLLLCASGDIDFAQNQDSPLFKNWQFAPQPALHPVADFKSLGAIPMNSRHPLRMSQFCDPEFMLARVLRNGIEPRDNEQKTNTSMKFSLEIGDTEKHTVEYEFNQLLGTLTIKVNDKPVKKHVRLFDEPVKELHVFVVGNQEKFAVKIEKERKLLFGQRNRVFVNDRLVKYCEGV